MPRERGCAQGHVLLSPPPPTDLAHQEARHRDAVAWYGSEEHAAYRISTGREEKEAGKGIKQLGRRLKGRCGGQGRETRANVAGRVSLRDGTRR